MEKSQKKFIKLPSLGGGREVLRKFLKEHLRYPSEALGKGVEGDVIIEYRVNGKGEILEAQVVHGIGYGCDEEALRLVRMLKYQAVSNKGLKVTTNNKIKIPFRLPSGQKPAKINMTYVPGPASGNKEAPAKQKPSKGGSYSYTVKF